jgi:hypothetical protein
VLQALVDFEVPEHAQQAVAQRHGTMITTAAGVFQLSVQKAGKAEWDALVAAQQGSDGIVKLRGLPTKAGVADVKAFLKVGTTATALAGRPCAHPLDSAYRERPWRPTACLVPFVLHTLAADMLADDCLA